MQIVLALDVDGTIETGGGPITVSRLQGLAFLGWDIWIVSASGNSPNRIANTKFKEAIIGDRRLSNLQAVKNSYATGAYFWLYVSDNPGDDEVARQAGFAFMHPKDFR